MSTYVQFVSVKVEGRKTECWDVLTNEGIRLGGISWYGAWRCYCFFPMAQTIFEKTCLRDIANFCEQSTTDYLKGKRA